MTFGWRHEFRERRWEDVSEILERVNWEDEQADYLLEIIGSVVNAGADRLLAITTSMHDLVVAPKPISAPPLDVVLVAAPGSLRRHAKSTVRIDHIAVNGPDTEITRPAADAVPLFWRFMRVEFGLSTVGPEQ
ncbi:MAG: hypothetical protein R2733_24530 [Acidimicrobiales bacterium]